jgi:alkanesulfonate monooxygenase SsuD/methylene tetrahydromethanopterin reductase-like flavin-dependent oxidoreductase (luciferase family)
LGLRLGGLGEGAELAERGGLDFVFLDNSTTPEARIGADPLSVAAFLMTRTHRLGLAASVPDNWPPFNVARALASFDLLSGGRCGWLPWSGAGEADNAGRSAEHLDVVLQLFDSWDDDALVFDKAASVFADRNKVRRICHSGTYFTVDGPLNAPRPAQGRPVLFQRGDRVSATADIELIDLEDVEARPPRPAGAPLRLAEVVVDLSPAPAGRSAALAERLAAAFRDGCDGFLLAPADPGADIVLLIGEVIPRLAAQGVVHPSPVPGHFRTQLGLPLPANRFAGQAIVAELALP